MDDEVNIILTLISLSYVDNKLDSREANFIKKLINQGTFGQNEKDSLILELHNPRSDFETPFKKIKSFYARNQLIDFSRVLFNVDEEFSSEEEGAYKRLVEINNKLSKEISNDLSNAAEELIKVEKNKKIYKELKEFGEILSYNKFSIINFLFPFTIFPHLKNNKYVILFVCILLIMVGIIKVIITQ